ncbi:MAG: hypothetical protein HKN36_01830 [Hellea sp.]|nr:hypothetical protein [Hellea sp.]
MTDKPNKIKKPSFKAARGKQEVDLSGLTHLDETDPRRAASAVASPSGPSPDALDQGD